jgi:hypothetical protein
MLVASAAVLLENFDRVGDPGDVVSFVDHASPRDHRAGDSYDHWVVIFS